MRMEKSDRRKFLSRTLSGGAAAGAAVALPRVAVAKKVAARKKVINRPGEQTTPASVISPGIQFGDLLFISGAGAHDPKTHKVVEGPFPNQVRQCLENLKTVLEAAGSSMDRVLKCNVFLTEVTDFPAMNEVFHTYFTTDPPARSTVIVKDLPGQSPVEIECIAYVG